MSEINPRSAAVLFPALRAAREDALTRMNDKANALRHVQLVDGVTDWRECGACHHRWLAPESYACPKCWPHPRTSPLPEDR